jgi:hypothetical protein
LEHFNHFSQANLVTLFGGKRKKNTPAMTDGRKFSRVSKYVTASSCSASFFDDFFLFESVFHFVKQVDGHFGLSHTLNIGRYVKISA